MSVNVVSPRPAHRVTVSSTFLDLRQQRAALIKCIKAEDMVPAAMEENGAATLGDVIDASLKLVRDGSAYIGIVSHKYGSVWVHEGKNAEELSLTELEYDEAEKQNRPTLIFIMGDDYPIPKRDLEQNPSRLAKLEAFRQRVKFPPGASVPRVYAEFNSLAEFKKKAAATIKGLRRFFDGVDGTAGPEKKRPRRRGRTHHDVPPAPPALYHVPAYVVSNAFIGRQSELQQLNDWASSADTHALLIFEAIGGNGKSMLTWEWTTHHATEVRKDWEGRFWYSFYEKGAVMADFCRRALAYITGAPFESFRKRKTRDLAQELLIHLRDKPWLLVLDGLERVLVFYHRSDAAEIADEEANDPHNTMARRDPCSAIRDEDDDLLRALAAAAPSKILVTSRLMPRALLNIAGQPIPDVKRVPLLGLRPPDAEALLRELGVDGNSEAIQKYLVANCDCHPLVIGVLAGLINNYMPDKGNFDAWATDPDEGGKLNLAGLNLVQRRNHILGAALQALPEKSKQLLATVSLLPESFDAKTVAALNPHLPKPPDEVRIPLDPEKFSGWASLPLDVQQERRRRYAVALETWHDYEAALEAYRNSDELRSAKTRLKKSVRDLESRGLLQYDRQTKRYDLHPVVRGVAAGGLKGDELERLGLRLVDYFQSQPQNPYEKVVTIDDVRNGLNLVKTLARIGHFYEALDAYRSDLSNAVLFKLEEYAEEIAVGRNFFSAEWRDILHLTNIKDVAYVAHGASIALGCLGEFESASSAMGVVIKAALEHGSEDPYELRRALQGIFIDLIDQRRYSAAHRILDLDKKCSAFERSLWTSFKHQFLKSRLFSVMGNWDDVANVFEALNAEDRDWPVGQYRPGSLELRFAQYKFWRGKSDEGDLIQAERLAHEFGSRQVLREIHRLRGDWRLETGDWQSAIESFESAVRMAGERGLRDVEAETGLALAKFHLEKLADPLDRAEEMSAAPNPAHLKLGALWLALGKRDKSLFHANEAYKLAWADGEPYVFRYELEKAAALLAELRAPIPTLPIRRPEDDERFPWEEPLMAFLEARASEQKT